MQLYLSMKADETKPLAKLLALVKEADTTATSKIKLKSFLFSKAYS